ncbi:MAG TPA: hypothetical protein VER17_00690 [Tepidisphaeraceae bacterium]|nr:hypothetical protein [Tepidisphaeraceae bacterium]
MRRSDGSAAAAAAAAALAGGSVDGSRDASAGCGDVDQVGDGAGVSGDGVGVGGDGAGAGGEGGSAAGDGSGITIDLPRKRSLRRLGDAE